MTSAPRFPERIVCLTEETTETLYLLDQGDRVVGISGYTVRPPEARSKPKVSAFINARLDKIEALQPDLVLAFSDLQADIAAALVRRGLPVFTFNQRSVSEILQMIRILGGIVGCPDRASQLTDELTAGLDAAQRAASSFPRRPACSSKNGTTRSSLGSAGSTNSSRSLAGRRSSRRYAAAALPRIASSTLRTWPSAIRN